MTVAKVITFKQWLDPILSTSEDGRYRHQILNEQIDLRPEILDNLKCFVDKAHEDARKHIRQVAGCPLDPLNPNPEFDPADGYPALLHMRTLKGYFGEILAGLVCEYFAPHDENKWKVPVYLFRFHDFAFYQLEKIRQTGEKASIIIGRSGDDCLAFMRDDHGVIKRVAFCEAKCTPKHRSDMIIDAHENVSDKLLKPVSLHQVIEVLVDRGDKEAEEWIESLRQLYFLESTPDDYERCDLVSYVCGQRPKVKDSWIPASKPHPDYSGDRRLEAVEIHLEDVEDLIRIVYGKKEE
jgi:hypothetical protein